MVLKGGSSYPIKRNLFRKYNIILYYVEALGKLNLENDLKDFIRNNMKN